MQVFSRKVEQFKTQSPLHALQMAVKNYPKTVISVVFVLFFHFLRNILSSMLVPRFE